MFCRQYDFLEYPSAFTARFGRFGCLAYLTFWDLNWTIRCKVMLLWLRRALTQEQGQDVLFILFKGFGVWGMAEGSWDLEDLFYLNLLCM